MDWMELSACNRGYARDLYPPAIFAIKISILLLLRRIFNVEGIKKSFDISLWCTEAFVLMYCSVHAILSVFHCKPANMMWDPALNWTGTLEHPTVDIVLMGGYRESVLRSAKPPQRQQWVPMKVRLNLRRVNLEV